MEDHYQRRALIDHAQDGHPPMSTESPGDLMLGGADRRQEMDEIEYSSVTGAPRDGRAGAVFRPDDVPYYSPEDADDLFEGMQADFYQYPDFSLWGSHEQQHQAAYSTSRPQPSNGAASGQGQGGTTTGSLSGMISPHRPRSDIVDHSLQRIDLSRARLRESSTRHDSVMNQQPAIVNSLHAGQLRVPNSKHDSLFYPRGNERNGHTYQSSWNAATRQSWSSRSDHYRMADDLTPTGQDRQVSHAHARPDDNPFAALSVFGVGSLANLDQHAQHDYTRWPSHVTQRQSGPAAQDARIAEELDEPLADRRKRKASQHNDSGAPSKQARRTSSVSTPHDRVATTEVVNLLDKTTDDGPELPQYESPTVSDTTLALDQDENTFDAVDATNLVASQTSPPTTDQLNARIDAVKAEKFREQRFEVDAASVHAMLDEPSTASAPTSHQSINTLEDALAYINGFGGPAATRYNLRVENDDYALLSDATVARNLRDKFQVAFRHAPREPPSEYPEEFKKELKHNHKLRMNRVLEELRGEKGQYNVEAHTELLLEAARRIHTNGIPDSNLNAATIKRIDKAKGDEDELNSIHFTTKQVRAVDMTTPCIQRLLIIAEIAKGNKFFAHDLLTKNRVEDYFEIVIAAEAYIKQKMSTNFGNARRGIVSRLEGDIKGKPVTKKNTKSNSKAD